MDKQRLLNRLEQGWQAFCESFGGLSDSMLAEPGVAGQWSIRDVLSHVTTWEEEALKSLPLTLEGKPFPSYSTVYGSIDAFNAGEQERKREFSLDRVKHEAADTHERLMAFLASVSPSAYHTNSRFMRPLTQGTYEHYREHTRQIEEWRTKRGS